MKKCLILFCCLIVSCFSFAQEKIEKEVADRVELLRKAMLASDGSLLDELTAEKLSYGHSNGLVEDKKEFIRKIASGESVYLKLDHSNQTIAISGRSAIVRLQFQGETRDGGKPNSPRLNVLMVWQKQGNIWKLLARQGVKIIS